MLVHQKADGGQPQAHRRPGPAPAGARRHGRLALGDVAQPGPRRAGRRRALPVAEPAVHGQRRLAAQRLLAGRPRGRPSTATAGASRCSTPCGTPTPTGWSPCSRATAACVAVLVNDTADAVVRAAVGHPSRLRRQGARIGAEQRRRRSRPGRPPSCRCRPRSRRPATPRASCWSRRRSSARGLWFFAEDRDSDAAAARRSTHRRPGPTDGYQVTVTAIGLVRDLALLVDKVDPDAVVDDMLVTLLPGESVTWQVTSAARASSRRPSSTRPSCAARTSCQSAHKARLTFADLVGPKARDYVPGESQRVGCTVRPRSG